MIRTLEDKLKPFRDCFTREAAFKWFVIIVVAFMRRSDFLGITSVIRDTMLDGNCYESMLHFFYSSAWSLDALRLKWYSIVKDSGFFLKRCNRCVLVGDGVKTSKEARFMPGVKKLFQESEDSSKGQLIWGHMFGAVGILLGECGKLSLPLKINIQDGIKAASQWENSTISGESHVVQIIDSGFKAAKSFGKSIMLLDRYFLTVPALERLKMRNAEYSDSENLLVLVTKAKSNCVAYRKPVSDQTKKRGRPKKKGESVKLKDFFNNSALFSDTTAYMYGKEEDVSYYMTDLLWGQGLYQELRFVFVKYKGGNNILVSTDLTMSPVDIIELYALRFKIENCFREFKQQFGGFCYHFWTTSLEKLNHYKRKEEPSPIEKITDPEKQKLILKKIRAMECFVFVSTVAMGLTQMISLQQDLNGEMQKASYTRILPKNRVSEATVINYFRNNFFGLLLKRPDSFITQYIQEKQIANSSTDRVA